MSAPDAPSAGTLPEMIGRYRVLGSLGHGSMGRVLQARDPNLDRDVAVKLLREDLKLAEPERHTLHERMRQEARASARLTHPNIVALYDIGDEPALGIYLVFEYVEGPTLEERAAGSPLGAAAAARLSRELGSALGAAHRAGIIHRDIKPANVILAATGGKIADFGIARIPGSTLTRDGRVLGTPAYSAPEAIETGELTAASDQFSLAATMYEAVSGRRAFPGDDAVTVAKLITTSEASPIASDAGLDPHVDAVLARAMARVPSRRFASAEDFGDALAEALLLAPRAAMPTLPDLRHRDAHDARASRRDLLVLGLGMVLGAALTAALFLLLPDRSPGGGLAPAVVPGPLDLADGGTPTETSPGAPRRSEAPAPPRPRVSPPSAPSPADPSGDL